MPNVFDELKSFLGNPEEGKELTETSTQLIKDVFPSDLSEFIIENGLKSYRRGFFYLVDPSEYYDVLEDWYEDNETKHVFLKTGFGSLFYLDSSDSIFYRLDISTGTTAKAGKTTNSAIGIGVMSDLSLKNILWYDYYNKFIEETGNVMRAECLSFVPSLLLGGTVEDSDVRRVKLKEYSSIQAQLAQ
ncbi:GAD-like domain-containing protein [Deinococcus sp.]|uniref:GAD-like domain-containing protein n=1 Tax=Deinococcus sp. TaxID=47478 RepID=UPI003B5A61E6